MQRTGTLFTVALALLVMASLFFVRHYLGVSRPSASGPGLQPASIQTAPYEADASRSPTVLSPDSVIDESTNVVSRASHDAVDRDASIETEAWTEPAVPFDLREPDSPIHLLPMRESFVPIPGPYSGATSLDDNLEGKRLSNRPHQASPPQ